MTWTSSSNCSIITVALPYHSEFLIKNAHELKKLNIQTWIVVGCDSNTNRKLMEIDKRFITISGAEYIESYGAVAPGVQHARSLKLGIDIVKTKNILILDPDFLILNIDQIECLIKDFDLSGKKIIGTPYFPIWYTKRMNAVAIYLAITTKKFLINEINLYPKKILDLYSGMKINNVKSKGFTPRILYFLKRSKYILLLYTMTFRRLKINTEFDICADTENYFSDSASEFLKIEITLEQISKISPHLNYRVGRKIEEIISRRFSYLPNQYNLLDSKFSLVEKQVEHYSYKNTLIGGHFRIFGNQQFNKKRFFTEQELNNYLNSVKF